MTEEQPDTNTESSISKSTFDWSVLFDKHFRQAFQDECGELPDNPASQDFQIAATIAFVSTLRESGIKQEDLVDFVGQAIWSQSNSNSEWTTVKSNRRAELIDKMFLDSITIEERFELGSLTRTMRAVLDTEENLPVSGAKKLYKDLLRMNDDE